MRILPTLPHRVNKGSRLSWERLLSNIPETGWLELSVLEWQQLTGSRCTKIGNIHIVIRKSITRPDGVLRNTLPSVQLQVATRKETQAIYLRRKPCVCGEVAPDNGGRMRRKPVS